MAKKCCEKEMKKAIDHAYTELTKSHREDIDRMYQQWEADRAKHSEEVGILRNALVDRNDLIRKLAKHIGRGV